MNAKKTVLGLLFSFAMVIILLPAMTFAEDEFDEPEINSFEQIQDDWSTRAESIALNQEKTVNTNQEDGLFKFIPMVSGKYVFCSESDGEYADPKGQIVDSKGDIISSGDDVDDEDRNFKIYFEAEAGEIYYLQAINYSGNATFTVMLIEDDGLEPSEENEYSFDICIDGITEVEEGAEIQLSMEQHTITAYFVCPEDNASISWYSSNPEVAEVYEDMDNQLSLDCHSTGTTVITATAIIDDQSVATRSFTVVIPDYLVELSGERVEGDSLVLDPAEGEETAEIWVRCIHNYVEDSQPYADDVTENMIYQWSSDDPDIATGEGGYYCNVTAVSEGSTSILLTVLPDEDEEPVATVSLYVYVKGSFNEFDEIDDDAAISIELGEDREWHSDDIDTKCLFKFVPDIDGVYVFTSETDDEYADPEARVLDEDGNIIVEASDKEESDMNFTAYFAGEKGKTYYLQAINNQGSATFRVALAESDEQIASLTFVPIKPFKFVQGVDCDPDDDWDNYWISFRSGDILVVDGVNYIYEDYGCFVNEYDAEDYIYTYSSSGVFDIIDDQSSDNEWGIGEHSFKIRYKGKETEPIPITVIENPIVSVEFDPGSNGVFELVENEDIRDSYYDEESSTSWSIYAIADFREGDTIQVEYLEGDMVRYEYDASQKAFLADGREPICKDDIIDRMSDYDDERHAQDEPWDVGNEYEYYFSYMDREFSVPIRIVEADEQFATDKRMLLAELGELLEQADDIIADGDSVYTEESYYGFTDLRSAALMVYDSALEDINNVTRYAISAEKATLESAIASLETIEEHEEKEARIRAVARAVALIASLDYDEEEYTAETYRKYALALDNLLTLLSNDGATSEEIDNAVFVLSERIADLETKADAEEEAARDEAVQDAMAVLGIADQLDEDTYTSETYATMYQAKQFLEGLLSNGTSTSVQINAAISALETAISNLKTKEEMSDEAAARSEAVIQAIEAIEKANVKESDYTPASMAKVTKAKLELMTLIADANATSAQIETKTKALYDAIKALQKKKAANTIRVISKNKTFKAKKLKKKKQSYKALIVTNAQGAVSYTVKPANKKAKKALKFNQKTGKITVKKKTKKGRYKITITVKAAGNGNYLASGVIKKTITVKVK